MCVADKLFLSLLVLFGVSSGVSLQDPERVELLDGGSYDMSIDYCTLEIYDESQSPNLLLSMSAHCFCLYDTSTETSYNCSSPGPTLVAYTGSTFDITFYNKLEGDDEVDEDLENEYRDLDIVNIHTHGLHIDPAQDDVTLTIAPGSSNEYTWTIAEDHYPGTHWYHPHHHGSTSFLIHSGLYGALIIEYDEDSDEYEAEDDDLKNMAENVLVIQYFYVVQAAECDCTDEKKLEGQVIWPGETKGGETPCYKDCGPVDFVDENVVYSYCFEYCAFSSNQRSASSFVYDMASYQDDWELFTINGQYEPVIDDMVIGMYRRIRLILTDSQYFRQFEFPTTNCDWYLVAIDGIYLLDDEKRDLSATPYNGRYLMFGGGRADIMVKCDTAGTYDIVSTRDLTNSEEELSEFILAPEDYTYFSLTVNADEAPYNTLDGNDIDTLPATYPDRPDYLTSQIDNDDATDECLCNTFYSNDVSNWLDEDKCNFMFSQSIGDVNAMCGLQFDSSTPLTYLNYGQVYEFYFKAQGHSYHQHVIPFQITEDIGDGYLAQAGDWFDTFASEEFTYRMYAADFTGHIIAHCHILTHEDTGMMGWFSIEEDGCGDGNSKANKLNAFVVFVVLFVV
eukprot:30377_1